MLRMDCNLRQPAGGLEPLRPHPRTRSGRHWRHHAAARRLAHPTRPVLVPAHPAPVRYTGLPGLAPATEPGPARRRTTGIASRSFAHAGGNQKLSGSSVPYPRPRLVRDTVVVQEGLKADCSVSREPIPESGQDVVVTRESQLQHPHPWWSDRSKPIRTPSGRGQRSSLRQTLGHVPRLGACRHLSDERPSVDCRLHHGCPAVSHS